MKRTILYIMVFGIAVANVYGQEKFEPIRTGAANFLTIPTDARSAAMGGTGVSLAGGNNAIFHNAATSIMDNSIGGVAYTFAPWMREYNSDFSLHTLAGFYKIDSRNALLAGVRYYNYPKVGIVFGEDATAVDAVHPKELAVELGYAREIIANLAVSATARFIHSDMGNLEKAKSSNAVAFDIGVVYRDDISLLEDATWSVGLDVKNLGTKIKYLDNKENLPLIAKLGGSAELPFATAHRLILAADLGYRMLPSDVQAFNVSAGAEYILIDHFLFRGGYHYGDQDKGDESYATAGVGVNYYGGHLDFAWLFAKKESKIRNSFWVSLGYSF